MPFLAIALRIFGPRIVGKITALPWKMIAWALLIAGVAAALYGTYAWARDSGEVIERHRWQPAYHELLTARENVTTLKAAIASQNAATAKWHAATEIAHAASVAALQRADKADAALLDIRNRAGKLAKVAPVGPCANKAGDDLARNSWSKI